MATNDIKININAKDLASRALKNVSNNISGLTLKMGGLSRLTSNMSRSMGAGFRRIGVAAGVAGTAVAAGFAFAVRTFAKFDSAMSAVAAKAEVSGVSIAQLREQAKGLGATTRFSASEAAQGMEMLAQAGFTTEQIMAGIPAVLDLAAAGAIGLKEASDIASDIGGAFKIPAEGLEHVADVLARTAAGANTDILMLGETMKFAAPIAQATGQSLEEVAAAAGILGNNGIKASVAGTDLKNMMSKLATTNVQSTLRKMGVSALDSSGEMRPLMDVMRDLDGKMGNMTGPKKASKMIAIFGERSAKSALILGSAGNAVDTMRGKVSDAGVTAKSIATDMQDNLGGVGVSIMSAFEGVQIALIETIKGPLMNAGKAIQQFLSGAITWIGDHAGVLTGIGETVRVIWEVLVSVVSEAGSAIASMFSGGGGEAIDFRDIMKTVLTGVITGLTFLETMLTNLPTVWKIMTSSASLAVLTLSLDIAHYVTKVIPNKFEQMKEFVLEIFRTLVRGMVGTMTTMTDFFANQFDKLAQFDPTGVAEKFASAWRSAGEFGGIMVDELTGKAKTIENVGPRAVTAQEKTLQGSIAGGAADIAGAFSANLAPRVARLDEGFAKAQQDRGIAAIGKAGDLLGKAKDSSLGQALAGTLFGGVFKGLLAPGGTPALAGAGESGGVGGAGDVTRLAATNLTATTSRLLTRGKAADPSEKLLSESQKQTKELGEISQKLDPKPANETTETVVVG